MECYICKKQISGGYYSDDFDRKICRAHLNNDAVICSSCGGIAKKEHPLPDGRYLCDSCNGMAIKAGDNIEQIRTNVVNSLNRVGFGDLRMEDITVEIVSAQKISEISKTPLNTNNKGFVSSTVTTGASGNRIFKHSIYMLTHQNRIELSAALAHEMLHAWQIQNGVAMSQKKTEGFCNLGAALMWNNQSCTLSKIYWKNLYQSPDPIYGDGLREMYALHQKLGWKELIANVKNKKIS